jgi:5-methylcytosine-specific restriction protein B
MTLNEYLKRKNSSSAFAVSQSEIGGIITFSNSGKRGSVKQFTLGLESFISILYDIKNSISVFHKHENYIEKEWRDLGSKYYTDGPSNAMSTVQTKPLFTTVSKIIAWANFPNLENIDTDQFIKINEIEIQNAIDKLEQLANKFKIQNTISDKEEIPVNAQVIYSYLVESMSHRKIQKDILGEEAPTNGGGYLTMKILHDFDIRDDKKGILSKVPFEKELVHASVKYKEGLLLLKKYYGNMIKLNENENIDFKKYFLKFRESTFKSISTDYSELFNEFYSNEKEWMGPIENKLHYIKLEADRVQVSEVIKLLKEENYYFNKEDESKLSTFSRVIDRTINASNFINNFTTKNLQNLSLNLFDFLNKIKYAQNYTELKENLKLSGTLSTFLPFYFSAVKHCQAPNQFPIYYKNWYTCLNSVYEYPNDYDTLTNFYRQFPESDRQLNFSSFFGAISKAILLEIKKDLIITSKESKAYKKLLKLITSESYIDEIFELNNQESLEQKVFNYRSFYDACLSANYFIDEKLATRFIVSLLTKPFLILTGLSGSGKTKLAQAFAIWICENENQFCIVPVGADWTNREPLLGFPNTLQENNYVKDEFGVLNLIIEANKNPKKPFFLILDEMNLSHVERYFADFLSVMESNNKISLHSGLEDWNNIPSELKLTKNLFIIGTVNIDETTYMFSPKVLDRANVIEFRVTEEEMLNFLENNLKIKLDNLEGMGSSLGNLFVNISKDDSLEVTDKEKLNKSLICFFSELKKIGAEFGYRSASEILRFAAVLNKTETNWEINDVIDIAIMQKLLPKLHGSRKKLVTPLEILAGFCIKRTNDSKPDLQNEKKNLYQQYLAENKESTKWEIMYPISLEKIERMYQNVIDNGFTSYAEA